MVGASVATVFKCDHCHTLIEVDPVEDIPRGWHAVRLMGWVGSFHGCSVECAEAIRGRYKAPPDPN